jgi:hypothetical protein
MSPHRRHVERPPPLAQSPYRRHVERPPPCDRHPDAPAGHCCSRCGGRACDDCLVFLGAGVVCSGCAHVTRRRGAIVRAALAVALAVACVVPSFAVLRETGTAWTPPESTVRSSIRICDADSLDLLLSSLTMHGQDRAIVSYGGRYAAECPLRPQTEGMISRARQRLADGLAP